MIICGEENGLLASPYCQFWQFCCWHDVLVLFQNPAWQAQTDTVVSLWVSRAKYQLHVRSSSWPFCSDSPKWRSAHMCTWFWRHGDAFGTTENAFFRAFITLRSQFHRHHRAQRALTEIVSKITPNLDLCFNFHFFLFIFKLCSQACKVCVYISSYCLDQHNTILTLHWERINAHNRFLVTSSER